MKNSIIVLLFCLFIILVQAQQIKQVKAKTTIQTEQSLTKTATKTSCIYNGKSVWKSSKGSFFIVVQSKKTGNWYKIYTTEC